METLPRVGAAFFIWHHASVQGTLNPSNVHQTNPCVVHTGRADSWEC